MTTMQEVKFRLALEDEGLTWDESESVVELAGEHLTVEADARADGLRLDMDEVRAEAGRAAEGLSMLAMMLDDLETLADPYDTDTVESLCKAIQEIVEGYADDLKAAERAVEQIHSLAEVV